MSNEEPKSYAELLEEFLVLANRLDEESEVALSEERGWKAAHQRSRKIISELRKVLPEMKKASMTAQNG